MSTLPNPWLSSSAEVVMPSVDTAAVSAPPGTVDAAAGHHFVLDEERFLADIEPLLGIY